MAERYARRALDVVGALLLIALFLPVGVLVALAIHLDSPGPLFYRQERLGRGGRPFWMLKFRSMVDGADRLLLTDQRLLRRYQAEGHKIPDDPRVTRVGRWLRQSSLDEVPQLLNVLMGDMSLVGPRPFLPYELCYYGDAAFEVLSVKPGVTGWWQVSGRGSIRYPERAAVELHYVRNRSLWFDLRILLLTLPAVLSRRGAF